MIDELERLANLWKAGALTDEEFAEQKMRLFAAQAAAPPASSEPISADMSSPDFPEAPEEEVVAPSTDDLLFDDLNALLEQAPMEPAPADPIDAVEESLQVEAAAPSDDDLLFDDLDALLESAPLEPSSPDLSAAVEEEPVEALLVSEAAPDEGEALSFDDLNAMLDAELAAMASPDEPADPDLASEAAEPMRIPDTPLPTEDDLLFDDLNALLADASEAAPADLADISDAIPAGTPPVSEEVLPADDVLSFDDLNAMLDAELSSMSPSETVVAADEMLPPVEVSPIEEAPAITDDDLLFDDLNTILAAEPVETSAPGEASRPVEELLANGAADDLDLAFDDRSTMEGAATADSALPADAVQPAEISLEIEALVEDAEPLAVAMAETQPETPAPAARPKIALGKIVAKLPRFRLPRIAFVQRLPQPVLLGLGAVALFTSSMGVGVALALATQSDAHPKKQAHGSAGADEGSSGHESDEAPSAEGASEHE